MSHLSHTVRLSACPLVFCRFVVVKHHHTRCNQAICRAGFPPQMAESLGQSLSLAVPPGLGQTVWEAYARLRKTSAFSPPRRAVHRWRLGTVIQDLENGQSSACKEGDTCVLGLPLSRGRSVTHAEGSGSISCQELCASQDPSNSWVSPSAEK